MLRLPLVASILIFLPACAPPVAETAGNSPGPTADAVRLESSNEISDGSSSRSSGPAATSTPGVEPPPSTVENREVSLDARELPQGSKVLHVGDSFAGALGLPLGKLLEERGVRSVLKHTDSSYLTDWAWDGNLQKYIWRYNPDLIIVTLGANELGIAEPERREKTVKKIVATIGERPCLWVAIPLWDGKQNGLMDVIEQHVSPCQFLNTNELMDVDAMPRISDGIHPTTAARQDWAQFVVDWLTEHRTALSDQPWHLSP